MNVQEYRNLSEAYLNVYEPQELTEDQVWEGVEEWVNALLEEGYDLSDYTWEEMYEGYITEILGMPGAQKAGAKVRELGGAIVNKGVSNVSKLAKGAADVAGAYGQGFAGQKTTSSNPLAKGYNAASRLMSTPARAVASFGAGVLGLGSKSDGGKVKSTTVPGKPASTDYKSKFAGARDAAFEKAKQIKGSPVVGPKKVGPKIVGSGSGSGGSTPASKPAATAAPKPTTPAAPTKPAGSAMDQFAKANPKLAAAQAEKDRIRGTSQSDNPLMKNMKDRMPMTPSVQSPTLKKDLGGGSGNQSLLNNPNASKAATPKKTPITSSFDYFDAVKGYLIDEGYADTEEAAIAIMGNMSDAWVRSIIR